MSRSFSCLAGLLVATLSACNGGNDDVVAADPNEGVRWTVMVNSPLDDCGGMLRVESLYGMTISGPYSPFALRDFIRNREGRTTRYLASPSGSGCGGEIAQRLSRLCGDGGVCRSYNTVWSCLLAIEEAFWRPFPSGMCDVCGDGFCGMNESVRLDEGGLQTACPEDCSCGNGLCEDFKGENLYSCPLDCISACGDGVCTGGEVCAACAEEGSGFEPGHIGFGEFRLPCSVCEEDCCTSACGDRTCVPEMGETPETCPQDCSVTYCGDGVCIGLEPLANCIEDCSGVPGSCLQEAAGAGIRCGGAIHCLNCAGACTSARERCGDGVCMGCEMWTCAMDCRLADFGVCSLSESGALECPGAYCGDGARVGDVENHVTCPQDCAYIGDGGCGDDVCSVDDLYGGCAALDCTPGLIAATCGDSYCSPGESVGGSADGDVLACPADCGGGR